MEEFRVFPWIARQIRRLHLRKKGPHVFSIQLAIVEEDHRVKPDVELGCELPQILDLVVPIDTHCRKMRLFEDHVWMFPNDPECILGIIATIDGENDAAIIEIP